MLLQAVEQLVDCVFEFNACVPYSGPCSVVLPRSALDGQALAALLALLPHELQPGVACNHLAMDDAKLVRYKAMGHTHTGPLLPAVQSRVCKTVTATLQLHES